MYVLKFSSSFQYANSFAFFLSILRLCNEYIHFARLFEHIRALIVATISRIVHSIWTCGLINPPEPILYRMICGPFKFR